MTSQRGMNQLTNVQKTFGQGNTAGLLVLNKRPRLALRSAALVVAVAVFIAAGALEPRPLGAYPPPHQPSPQEVKRRVMVEQRKAQEQQARMLQELLKQQQLRHQQEQRLREEYQKQLQKQLQERQKNHLPVTKPGVPPPAVTKGGPHLPGMKPGAELPLPISRKRFPQRAQARNALISALRQVHAVADLPVGSKEMAIGTISEAIGLLGDPPPMPLSPVAQKGNHRTWATEDLQRAQKEVIHAALLPPPMKVPVLEKINQAVFILHHPDMPYPKMEKARSELIAALHQVNAAVALDGKAKGMALGNIREALHVLGEVSPEPMVPSQKGDHVLFAERHLQAAYKGVIEERRLPPEQRVFALREIQHAMFVLRYPAMKFPDLKVAKDQLVYALHQVHAAKEIRADYKELAKTSVGNAISALGETPRSPQYEPRGGNHIRDAEMHLNKAREDLRTKMHLPEREYVFKQIDIAEMALKEGANPGSGGSAAK